MRRRTRPPGKGLTGVMCLLALCGIGLWAPLACAEADPNPEAVALARSYFSQGLEHLDAGRWGEAAASFHSALELRASPELRFNLSRALSEMGRLSEAVEQLEHILSDPGTRKRVRQAALALNSELRPKLGTIILDADEDDRILLVSLDGQARADWKRGMQADPGSHDLKVTRLNAAAIHNQLEIKPGELLRIRLLAPPEKPAPPAAVSATQSAAKDVVEPSHGQKRSHGWAWWAAGAAGAALAGVAVLAVQRGGSDAVQGTGGQFTIGAP